MIDPRVPLGGLLAASLLLSACVGNPDTREEVAEQQEVPMAEQWAEGAADGKVADNWIDSFQDATLTAMVAEAMANNSSLAQVAGRVSEAEAQATLAGAQLKPTVSAALGATGTDGGSAFGAGLQASWELDVWDRMGQAAEAAVQDLLAAQSDLVGARNLIAARVSDAWFLSISARQQLELATNIRNAYKATRETTEKRKNAGTAQPGELELARSDEASAEAKVREKEGALKNAQRALEILLGRYPGAELEVVPELPPLPAPPPAGMPSALLERRPDVVAADRRVNAAFNRTGSARAARMPRIQLTANVGTTSGSLSDALNPSNALWNLGAGLVAPIFDGGRLKAEQAVATAQQEQAVAGYRDVALNAFKEVEDGLSNDAVIRNRLTFIQASSDELDKALNIATKRYDAGVIDILALNQVQLRAFTAREQVVALRAEQLRQRVSLYLALGGDFESVPDDLAPSPEQEAKMREEQAAADAAK
ncbi:MAG: efflux transporter outer membrane subunit [Planctomycetota bacterium]|jgi:NodT family efflux transporter outer membrane factor (OMF) lipoprotein|nr:efflux transporter outer membrane subunit [Planctomycetota bacterium]